MDKLALLDRLDGHAGLRNALRVVGNDLGRWSGIPMPLEGEQLVIEPTYPMAEELMRMCGAPKNDDPDKPKAKVRNSFWSSHMRSDIVIFDTPDGRADWGLLPGANHLDHDLKTLMCSDVWGIEQESNALQLLGTLVAHRPFKQYLLTGSFIETSRRSGVTYMFRKLKPTVAIKNHAGKLSILCALCMHPVAYYDGSWAGAMTPTDDVIAHLMLMRSDEAMFWRRANQHPAYRPQAGV